MWLPHATTERRPPGGELKGVAAVVPGGPFAAMVMFAYILDVIFDFCLWAHGD
jgi:hypothetical protein